MPISVLAGLLAQFGPQAYDIARGLIAKWNSDTPVTAADIDELERMGKRTAREAVEDSLRRAGIALDSDQGKALLALIP